MRILTKIKHNFICRNPRCQLSSLEMQPKQANNNLATNVNSLNDNDSITVTINSNANLGYWHGHLHYNHVLRIGLSVGV